MQSSFSFEMKGKWLLLCILGFALYAILNVLAMIFYLGGTASDHGAVGYSFLDNFFSDLGMKFTYSGEMNTLSFILFASSLVLVGVVLALFFILLSTYFKDPGMGKNQSKVGTIAGCVAGISCIGIAFSPWDRYLVMHMVFAYLLSLSFLGVAFFYSVAIFRNPEYPRKYAYVFNLYFVVLLMFTALMVLRPDSGSPAGARLLATGQKICIYSGMLCMFIQVAAAYKINQRHIERQEA